MSDYQLIMGSSGEGILDSDTSMDVDAFMEEFLLEHKTIEKAVDAYFASKDTSKDAMMELAAFTLQQHGYIDDRIKNGALLKLEQALLSLSEWRYPKAREKVLREFREVLNSPPTKGCVPQDVLSFDGASWTSEWKELDRKEIQGEFALKGEKFALLYEVKEQRISCGEPQERTTVAEGHLLPIKEYLNEGAISNLKDSINRLEKVYRTKEFSKKN